MTPTEFKAWFEGYSENIPGTPSKDQFERIKEQVAKLDESILKLDPHPITAPDWKPHVDTTLYSTC